jgi:addiction module RelB/DinJ family antitoxin
METVVSIKMDKKVKEQASKLAKEMGFSLSAVINATLYQFVKNKELHITVEPRMTAYLENIVAEAKRDYKAGRHIKRFKNMEDLIVDLDK